MNKKTRLLAAVIVLLLTGGGVVWASDTYKQIGVYFERVQLIINDQYIPMTKDSIIYEGTVYVPLRTLGERLGAIVSWDQDRQAVNYTFSANNWSALNLAGRMGLYQYIMIENDGIMKQMTEALRNDDMTLLADAIARYKQLEQFASTLESKDSQNSDAGIVLLLSKIRIAAEMLHTGWMERKVEDYYLAMEIFQENEQLLMRRLQSILNSMGQ